MIRLTDEQWERIRDHFPEEHIPDGRPGRKPIPPRRVLEAVLWILNTGAQWHMLPQSYPNYKTVHRRFQTWCCNEVLRRVLTDVANELRDKGALDEAECFIDATFVMAKGGGAGIGPTKRGKSMKIMIEAAIAAISREPAGGLIAAADPFAVAHRTLIMRLAQQLRLPADYGLRQFVAEGGLMSYGPDTVDIVRRSASYVDRILKGATPADL